MKIGPLQAFGISFAIGFIIAIAFGSLLVAFFGTGLTSIVLILAIISGIVYGIFGVIIYFIWRVLSRRVQFAIAGVLLIIGLFFFPPLDAIAIVGFILSFAGVKKGR